MRYLVVIILGLAIVAAAFAEGQSAGKAEQKPNITAPKSKADVVKEQVRQPLPQKNSAPDSSQVEKTETKAPKISGKKKVLPIKAIERIPSNVRKNLKVSKQPEKQAESSQTTQENAQ
ncbi:hypothetical protein J7K99_01760 [bacterium]|nr:hypothetical protein [bacterium]